MRDERRSTERHRLRQREELLPRVHAARGDVRHARSSDARPTGRAHPRYLTVARSLPGHPRQPVRVTRKRLVVPRTEVHWRGVSARRDLGPAVGRDRCGGATGRHGVGTGGSGSPARRSRSVGPNGPGVGSMDPVVPCVEVLRSVGFEALGLPRERQLVGELFKAHPPKLVLV